MLRRGAPPTPDPNELQYVLIAALGRSGSTLIQGVLNSFGGFCIRGENNNVCHHLFRSYKALSGRKRQFSSDNHDLSTPRHPWYGLGDIDLDALTQRYRSLVVEEILRPPPETTHTGFKEIRYATGSVSDLDGYLEYLNLLFPNLKIVVNTRNPADVANSSFWRKRDGDTQTHVRESQERLVSSVGRSGVPSVTVRYEDYTTSVDALRPIAELLEQPWNPEQHQAVLSRQHSI